MIYDHWEVWWVNISVWEPKKGPEKVKNGRFNMFSFFWWLQRYIARRWDERWVSMQKISSFRQKTAEIASGSCWYYKSSLPQSELVRAVFFRRLPFKSFDTRDVNMLVAWTRPEKRPWGPSGLKVFFWAPNSQGPGRLITKSEVWEMFQWMWMTPETWYLTIGMLGEWISAFGPPKKARIRPKMGFRQWKKISSDPNWLYLVIGMKNTCPCKIPEI